MYIRSLKLFNLQRALLLTRGSHMCCVTDGRACSTLTAMHVCRGVRMAPVILPKKIKIAIYTASEPELVDIDGE